MARARFINLKKGLEPNFKQSELKLIPNNFVFLHLYLNYVHIDLGSIVCLNLLSLLPGI